MSKIPSPEIVSYRSHILNLPGASLKRDLRFALTRCSALQGTALQLEKEPLTFDDYLAYR